MVLADVVQDVRRGCKVFHTLGLFKRLLPVVDELFFVLVDLMQTPQHFVTGYDALGPLDASCQFIGADAKRVRGVHLLFDGVRDQQFLQYLHFHRVRAGFQQQCTKAVRFSRCLSIQQMAMGRQQKK